MKKLLFGFICFSLLITGWLLAFDKETIKSAPEFSSLITKGQSDLSHKKITDFELNEASFIKDKVINNTDFIDVVIYNAKLENITFNNCLFKKAIFLNISMKNVTFNNCRFKAIGSPKSKYSLAYFDASILENVIIDGGDISSFSAYTEKGGNVILKNIKVKLLGDEGRNFFSGYKLNIRADNCVFEDDANLTIVNGKNEATLHVTNSRFIGSGTSTSRNLKAAWYENCHFEESPVGIAHTVVFKNSYLNMFLFQPKDAVDENQTVYATECEFPLKIRHNRFKAGTAFVMRAGKGAVYIYGKQPQQKDVNLDLFGGHVFIFDAQIQGLYMEGSEAPPLELNLTNVLINGGSWTDEHPLVEWADVKISKGLWDNVSIYPQVNVKGARIENLIVHKLQLPEGPPWVNATEETFAPLTERAVPLNIPRPPVPTLEELGIIDTLQKGNN